MARSAVIPRLYKLPIAISSLFGKSLSKDGTVNSTHKSSVVAIKKWYDETRRFLPDGTILLQSSTAHTLPYPAYLYGKGTWASIDILYFMPDIPITFMNEIEGEVYNISQTNIYQHEMSEIQRNQEVQMGGGLKRTDSKILLALGKKDEDEQSQFKPIKSARGEIPSA